MPDIVLRLLKIEQFCERSSSLDRLTALSSPRSIDSLIFSQGHPKIIKFLYSSLRKKCFMLLSSRGRPSMWIMRVLRSARKENEELVQLCLFGDGKVGERRLIIILVVSQCNPESNSTVELQERNTCLQQRFTRPELLVLVSTYEGLGTSVFHIFALMSLLNESFFRFSSSSLVFSHSTFH